MKEDRSRNRRGSRYEGSNSMRRYDPEWAAAVGNGQNFNMSKEAWPLVQQLLRRSFWVLLATLIFGFLAFMAGINYWTSFYTATAKLMRHEQSNTDEYFRPQHVPAQAYASLMKTAEQLEKVGEKMQPPIPAKKLRKRIGIVAEWESEIINITASGSTKDEAAKLANLYAEESAELTRERQIKEAREVESQVQEILGNLEQEIRVYEQKLEKRGGKLARVNFDSPENKTKRLEVLNEELAKALSELSKHQKTYTDLHPLVKSAQASVANIKKEMTELAADVDKQIDDGAAKGLALNDGESSEVTIQTRLSPLLFQHADLRKRLNQVKSLTKTAPGYFRLVASANVLDAEAHPREFKVAIVTLVGAGLGFMTSILLILLIEFMDDRIKTRADVERVTGLKVLAAVGDITQMAEEARIRWSFRTWTALQHRLSKTPNHGLVCGITASMHGEGTSTWVQELAQAASQQGFRVLTIATVPSGSQAEVIREYEPNQEAAAAPEPEYATAGAAKAESSQAQNGKSPGNAPNAYGTTLNPNGTFSAPAPDVDYTSNGNSHDLVKNGKDRSLMSNVLSSPMEVTEMLINSETNPLVHIPLPGWVWNLERRKQWHSALNHWKRIENIVILVELPPSSMPESVLLAENLPNLVWLADSGRAEAAETRAQLETLRHARCNLVGAFLNREQTSPMKRSFARWFSGVSTALLLSTSFLHAEGNDPLNTLQLLAANDEVQVQQAAEAPTAAEAEPDRKGNFSATSSTKRAAWQQKLTLGPGDVLNVTLFGNPDLTRQEIAIGPDGRLSYMQADVMAAGLTVDELRKKLDEELAKYYREPRTVIYPQAYKSKKYYVLGKVMTRGAFVLDRPVTILEAIARASGLETGVLSRNSVDLADLQKASLMRNGQRVPINFEKLFYEGDLTQNALLEPDDFLFFPPASIQEIYVLGEVRTPGPVPLTTARSLIGAISGAGGFNEKAWKSHILVIRGSLNKPETYIINTASILNARTPDFPLEAKDIVFVNNRPFARAEELLDLAATAFLQSAVSSWSGLHIGPLIDKPFIKGPKNR